MLASHFGADSAIPGSLLVGTSENAAGACRAPQATCLCTEVVLRRCVLVVEVLAEGVETYEHAALLREMGCDLGQGNYFAEPLLGEELAQRLSTVFLPYQPRLSFE